MRPRRGGRHRAARGCAARTTRACAALRRDSRRSHRRRRRCGVRRTAGAFRHQPRGTLRERRGSHGRGQARPPASRSGCSPAVRLAPVVRPSGTADGASRGSRNVAFGRCERRRLGALPRRRQVGGAGAGLGFRSGRRRGRTRRLRLLASGGLGASRSRRAPTIRSALFMRVCFFGDRRREVPLPAARTLGGGHVGGPSRDRVPSRTARAAPRRWRSHRSSRPRRAAPPARRLARFRERVVVARCAGRDATSRCAAARIAASIDAGGVSVDCSRHAASSRRSSPSSWRRARRACEASSASRSFASRSARGSSRSRRRRRSARRCPRATYPTRCAAGTRRAARPAVARARARAARAICARRDARLGLVDARAVDRVDALARSHRRHRRRSRRRALAARAPVVDQPVARERVEPRRELRGRGVGRAGADRVHPDVLEQLVGGRRIAEVAQQVPVHGSLCRA